MTPIDPNAPTSDVQQYDDSPVDGTTSAAQEAPGVSGDAGGQDDAVDGSEPGAGPSLDDPSGGLNAQSYSDSADSLAGFSIEAALIALAKASIEDKESEQKAQLQGINSSFQESMDAVDEEDAAAEDTYTAAMWKAGSDMASNAVGAAGAIGSGVSGMSDAKVMAADQASSAAGGILGDVGSMVAAGDDEAASKETSQANADKAEATKLSSYAQTDGDAANLTGETLSSAIELIQKKADDELTTNRSLTNFS